MTTHRLASDRISANEDDNVKRSTESLHGFRDAVESAHKQRTTFEAPLPVKNLDHKARQQLEKTLVRKIDVRLLPAVIIMYIMNYLDRNNIATARLSGSPGLQKDLDMTDSQYETCVSILFVGYILMQIPSNLFLNKVGKPALYLPAVMVIWGAISLSTAATKSFGGLLAIRFILGFVEAAYFPGCLYFLSCWYTRKELAFRSAVLYSGSLISGAFAGLLAAGITRGMDRKMGISAWKWLFIIEGSVTIFIATCCFFMLPNFPLTTKWLTEEERQLAVWRLQEDIGMDDWTSSKEESFWNGMFLAFKDTKVWILMVMLLGIISAGSVTNFFPTVVQSLGNSNMISLLLTTPPYVLTVITALANAAHADKTGERFLHISLPLSVGMASFILAASTIAVVPRYIAMMLMLPGIYSGFVVGLAWISNTIPRPPAKRAAALAAINAVSNASSIYASYMYSGGPRYIIAFTVNCSTLFLAILMAALLRVVLIRLNAKLDREDQVDVATPGGSDGEGDAARKAFRFLV